MIPGFARVCVGKQFPRTIGNIVVDNPVRLGRPAVVVQYDDRRRQFISMCIAHDMSFFVAPHGARAIACSRIATEYWRFIVRHPQRLTAHQETM
jgi:hypothetical protein